MTNSVIIETQGLTKKYDSITAVDNLNLELYSGEIFGLLGPNGAGKTTTLLMLLGLSEPTSGKVRVAGLDPMRQPLEVKEKVGYMPDNIGFYLDLTGRENLQYTARLNGIGQDRESDLIDDLLVKVGLKDAAHRRVREYSRGMRQRLGVADVLLKDPKIIIMDEPTLGLDPEGISELLAMIMELGKKEGKTILISSHLLHQVQAVCDRVGIFVRGKLVAIGSVAELAGKLGSDQLVEVQTGPGQTVDPGVLESLPGISSVETRGETLLVRGEGVDLVPTIARALLDQGIDIYHLKPGDSDLDRIYHRYFQEEEEKSHV